MVDGEQDVLEVFEPVSCLLFEAHRDVELVGTIANGRRFGPVDGRADRLRDLNGTRANELGLFAVDSNLHLRATAVEVVFEVDQTGHALDGFCDLLGQLTEGVPVVPDDLDSDRCTRGWTVLLFANLKLRARDLVERGTNAFDGFGCRFDAIFDGDEVHLNLRKVRSGARLGHGVAAARLPNDRKRSS